MANAGEALPDLSNNPSCTPRPYYLADYFQSCQAFAVPQIKPSLPPPPPRPVLSGKGSSAGLQAEPTLGGASDSLGLLFLTCKMGMNMGVWFIHRHRGGQPSSPSSGGHRAKEIHLCLEGL